MAQHMRAVDNAARVLGCSARTVQRQLEAGRLFGQNLGRDWAVSGSLDTGDIACL